MKKILLILCALLLTAVGASAQDVTTAYEFKAENWVVFADHSEVAQITSTENNTITVSSGTSATNVGLTNSATAAWDNVTNGVTTSQYYITEEQKYFVVVGSGLNTSYTDNTYSQLWWMNGVGGPTAKPDYVVELTDETTGSATGEALFAWDLSAIDAFSSVLTPDNDGHITLTGWTGFGLTSTTGTSAISYIGFYTQEQIDALITGKPYEFKNTDWVGVYDRSANDGQVTYSADESNTITVTSTGANNIALENKSENDVYATANYYVTAEQHWFVIKGTDLSTQDGDSYIWFMNGVNYGTSVAPSETITLEDGSVMLAWDLTKTGLDDNMTSERNYLTGYICFGLTSSDQSGKSTISYIGFYTEEEVEANLTITPYEFNAKDWAATSDHSSVTTVTYDEEGNTITVTATGDTNVALSNSPTANDGDPTIGITTGLYTVTNEQIYFVVIGSSDLSTDISKSKLWWMNHANIGGNVDPTITTLSDGRIVFAWDLSGTTAFPDATNLFDGWTCFALTSTSGTSVISDINFYTEDEVEEMISGYDHFCTANESHWTSSDGAAFWVDTAVKDDGSGMEPPFLTYYVWEGEGATLSDATFTHETLTLESGLYEVSMQIRVIDYDEGTIGEGTLFSATTGSTTVSQDIKLGVDATEISFTDNGSAHDDVYGTYTLYVEVGEEGTLSVSLDITGATYNWIMWKNLKVRLLGEDEEIPSGTVSGTMQAEYGTLILPFDATITDGLTAYTAGEVTNDADGESVLTLTAVDGNLTAGTPYIIGGSANTTYSFAGVPTKYEVSYTDGLLTGTLVNMSLANSDFTADGNEYVLQNHDEGGLAFYPITTSSTDVTLSAYHCYLTYSNPSGVKGFISFPNTDDETTAIEAVEGAEAEANGAIYDLSGRRVSKAVKGVYIQNGKKVLVK